jgi:hypothetical protein
MGSIREDPPEVKVDERGRFDRLTLVALIVVGVLVVGGAILSAAAPKTVERIERGWTQQAVVPVVKAGDAASLRR